MKFVDVNGEGRYHQMFLKLALQNPDFDLGMARILLGAGSNPNDDNAWPVPIAIYFGSAPLLAAVLAAGGDPNRLDVLDTPVFFTAAERPQLLAQLLAGGARIEATDYARRTLLLEAVRGRNWQAANVLLDLGANRQATDHHGRDLRALLLEAREEDVSNGRAVQPGFAAMEARLDAGR